MGLSGSGALRMAWMEEGAVGMAGRRAGDMGSRGGERGVAVVEGDEAAEVARAPGWGWGSFSKGLCLLREETHSGSLFAASPTICLQSTPRRDCLRLHFILRFFFLGARGCVNKLEYLTVFRVVLRFTARSRMIATLSNSPGDHATPGGKNGERREKP